MSRNGGDSQEPGAPFGARRALWAAALFTAVWTALWIFVNLRENIWFQEPNWDWANYHATALLMKRKIAGGHLLDAWVNTSGAHTPFLQLSSAVVMLVAGESRIAAESVLILYTFAFAYFTFRIVDRLYDARTAAATLAVVFCFPVFLLVSRVYLLEHPIAALFAASMWALVRSQRLTRWGPILAFGALAGIASVTRLMGFVYFIGPGLVLWAVSLRRVGFVAASLRMAAAAALAVAIAATWYVPNREAIYSYVSGVTVGAQRKVYTDGIEPLSFENAWYFIKWIVYEGPGVPLGALALGALAWHALRGRARTVLGPPMAACLAIFAVDFLFLFVSGQRIGARYYLPVMPILALALVRLFTPATASAAGRLLLSAVAALLLHHAVALTFLTKTKYDNDPYDASDWAGTPLWNHGSLFLGMARAVQMDPFADLRVRDAVDAIERAGAREDAAVFVMSEHPFFQVHSVRLEAVRRKHSWRFTASELLRLSDQPRYLENFRQSLRSVDFVVARTEGVNYLTDLDFLPILDDVLQRGFRDFEEVCPAIPSGDGAKIRVYRSIPPTRIGSPPDGSYLKRSLEFTGGASSFALPGLRFRRIDDSYRLELCFLLHSPMKRIPPIFMQVTLADEARRKPGAEILSGRFWDGHSIDGVEFGGPGPWYLYHQLDFSLPELANVSGGEPVALSIGFLAGEGGNSKRYQCQSADGGLADNGTRVDVAWIGRDGGPASRPGAR